MEMRDDPGLRRRGMRWRDVRPRLDKPSDRSTIARTIAGLFGFGGLLLLVSIALPAPVGRDSAGIAFVGVAAVVISSCIALAHSWLPVWFLRIVPVAGTAMVGAAIYFGGTGDVAAYAMLFLWVLSAAALFFELELIIAHGLIAVAVYAVVLELEGSKGPYGVQLVIAAGSVIAITVVMTGIASQLRRRMVELEMTAQTDPLTGVLNRRALADAFTREFARAQRTDDGVLGLIVLDLDHFKRFNDVHGHPTGDMILRRLCDVLIESSRSVDYVVRLGGEEFAVLAPEADLSGALVMAERLRRVVEIEFSPAGERLTISCGVAAYPISGSTSSELMAAADQALYDAKAQGRNRALASTSTGPPGRVREL